MVRFLTSNIIIIWFDQYSFIKKHLYETDNSFDLCIDGNGF